MRLPAWLVVFATVLVAPIITPSSSSSQNAQSRLKRATSEKRVVCYYTNWSVYRPGTAKFNPQNINPYLCTHLVYAFGGLSKENSLKAFDKYQDVEQGGYAKFNGLKTYNKNLKTMVAIGGWNEGSARFSPLVADADRRKELVRNVIKFLRQNHFDGLDLDWEYPAFRDGGKARDRDNYAKFVQELREEFDRESSKTGRTRLLLTMAVPAGIEYIDKGYDVPKLNEYLDWFNILSYDYHSAFEPSVDHHAPLLPLEPDDEYNFGSQLNIDATVKHYLKLGADRNKLVLGIPTYGRSYTLFNPDATDIGSPADGPGEQGEATREKGYLAYYEICERIKNEDWTVVNDNPDAMGPYAYKGNQWVGYDDEAIVRAKSKYVNENDLGGIMFWSIDNDDFRGKCHNKPYPLIEAAKEALLASGNELVEIERPSKRPEEPVKPKRKPKPKPKTTTTESTKLNSQSTTTPQPPTTPDPGSDFVCKDEGFFPHPRDCKKYFWCLDSGPSSLGIVAHQFTCPSGLVFNKISDSCDYARNVICKNKIDAITTTSTTAATTTSTTARNKLQITAAPPRHRSTSTTTTTTTTTEEPAEYEEYEENGQEEDPGTIKELIGLIKRLGGVEQLEKQLTAQEGSKAAIKPSLFNKVLAARPGTKYRGSQLEESSTIKYQSLFRNRPSAPQSSGIEKEKEAESTRTHEKPQYTTILRNRAPSRRPSEADNEDENEEEEEEEEKEDATTPKSFKRRQPEREYTSVKRTNQRESSDQTTPKYKNIQRTRSTTEAPSEEEDAEEPTELDTTEKSKKYSAVYRESKPREQEGQDNKEKVSAVRPQYVTLTRERVTKPSNMDQESEPTTPVNNVNRVKYVDVQRRKLETTTTSTATPDSVNSVQTTESERTTENLLRRVDQIRKRTRLPVLTTTEEPKRYQFPSRSRPKPENFTIVVPETTVSFSDSTPTVIKSTTTQRSVPKTSTVTSVVTSITESSFTERQKISVTKKPTVFTKKIDKNSQTTTERPRILRFRPRSTTSTSTTTTTTTTTTEPPKRARSRFSSSRKIIRLRRPKPDLDTQESSSAYDDDDNDDVNSRYILGETIKKKSKNDFLSAQVLFATVPTVEREESAITTPRAYRGRIKAQDSITENIPEDYRKKIRKVFKRRKTEQRPVPETPTTTTTTTTTTTSSPPRRSSQIFLTNLRSRQRVTTSTTTTTSTERPTRRPIRRKFRPDRGSTTTGTDNLSDSTVTSPRSAAVRRRTRPTKTTTTTTTTTTEPAFEIEARDADIDLPDLADPAVVAIHNLATLAPAPILESPRPFTAFTSRPATSIDRTQSTATFQDFSPSLRPSTRIATSYSDFQQSLPLTTRAFSQSTAKPFALETENRSSTRSEVVIAPRRQQTTTQPPPAPAPVRKPTQRKLKPFSKTPKKPQHTRNQDYEYYDDADALSEVPVPISALKVKVHSDGYIECLDQGNFPHPFSCKKFISCAKMENSDLLGWEYTCPKHLSFDPVGGICNWSAGLGCQQ